MPIRFYIASKLENASQVKEVAAALKAAGHIHTYDWTVHGSVQREGQKKLCEVSEYEKLGVLDADIVIVILPGGRGTHAELGMANAYNKTVIICAENDSLFLDDGNTCAFYWNPCCVRCVGNPQKWINEILHHARIEDAALQIKKCIGEIMKNHYEKLL